jgi:hypothetical protein
MISSPVCRRDQFSTTKTDSAAFVPERAARDHAGMRAIAAAMLSFARDDASLAVGIWQ